MRLRFRRFPKPPLPGADELAEARALIGRCKNPFAWLALLGDKRFVFSPGRNAFVMYGMHGRTWIALGDPIGADAEVQVVLRLFWEMCDARGVRFCFYGVGEKHAALYRSYGLSLYKIGEEARLNLASFMPSGGRHQKFRQLVGHLEREGISFEVIEPGAVAAALPDLKRVSESWLSRQRTREKRFSLGCFKETYLKNFPVALVKRKGRVLAFSNLLCGADRTEFSGDLIRYHRREAPAGVMDYLFFQLLLWGKKEGYRAFNMGMAPLSGLEPGALNPRWSRLGHFLYQHSEHFYHFRGVRRYKEKFHPEWTPKWMAAPGGMQLPRVLADLAVLISGGWKGLVAR